MTWRCLSSGLERTYVLVCAPGQDPVIELTACARAENLAASRLTAIGGFSRAILGFFDKASLTYRHIPVDEQSEVLSLVGDVTLDPDGGHQVHVHAVLGGCDGRAKGGHLISATVDPTLEMLITESPAHLRRTHDRATGLALIDLERQ